MKPNYEIGRTRVLRRVLRLARWLQESSPRPLHECAEHFQVSEKTIRRDVRALQAVGESIALRGGANLDEESEGGELDFQ